MDSEPGDEHGRLDGDMVSARDAARVQESQAAARPWLKENALALADDHRATCESPDCSVSLMYLGELLQLAGYEMTDEDWRRCM